MTDFVLYGRVLTVDRDRRVHARGAVYVHDGVIEAVQPRTASPPSGFGSARRVRTGGLITPGLIDLHNHLAYNTLPLWIFGNIRLGQELPQVNVVVLMVIVVTIVPVTLAQRLTRDTGVLRPTAGAR